MSVKVSAVIPAYNAAKTIRRVIHAIKSQTYPVASILLVDDASTDATLNCAREEGGVEIKALKTHQGRGYVRAIGVECSLGEFVLSCDTNNSIGPDFLEKALRCFKDPRVAAVFGSLRDCAPKTVGDRWRAFYLYRQDEPVPLAEVDFVNAGAIVLRKDAVIGVGNFNKECAMHEDHDLSQRLRKEGWKLLHDPELLIEPLVSNSIRQVLERYARWNASMKKGFPLREYLSHVWYSIKVMAWKDLKRGDIPCMLVSLLCPHYQLMKHLMGKKAS